MKNGQAAQKGWSTSEKRKTALMGSLSLQKAGEAALDARLLFV
jgi:hypothetical protein